MLENVLKRIEAHGAGIKNRYFLGLSALLLSILLFAYANHFNNAFQFDDSHTIESNESIRTLDPVLFFTDATTFSALATNQSYRPFTTLENALDYTLAGGLDPKVFHIHIFITYIVVLLLLFWFTKKLLDHLGYSKFNPYWALGVTTFFGLLTVNAETVNYIIQRAEITAALFVLAGLAAFLQGGAWRKWHMYLIFPFIGFFAKEMTLVFAPLLLLYLLIFEEQVFLLHFYKKATFKKCLAAFIKAIPAFVLTIAFYVFYSKMRPDTFFPGGPSQFMYLITQPMVICHYVLTFFFPYNLSADTDWQVYTSLTDYRVVLGFVFMSLLLYAGLKASKNDSTRLFSFGILWFFISLLPTSSFIPFAEVLNDHRTFIPYIGLTLAVVFGGKYSYDRFLKERIPTKTRHMGLLVLLLVFIVANTYGIRQRNKVWLDHLSLWEDVTVKSPKNGRGLMNYGLALMAKGDLTKAGDYFGRAMEFVPNYDVLHVNLGILNTAQGNGQVAEDYFLKALELNPNNHTNWYYFGRFLANSQRNAEAIAHLEKALSLSPNYAPTSELLMTLYYGEEQWDSLKRLAEGLLATHPNHEAAKKYIGLAATQKTALMVLEEEAQKNPSPQKYVDLSLAYFNRKKYQETIFAANKALALKNDFPQAYNNIGIAYYNLNDHDRAIEAYDKAISLDPTFQIAQNNRQNAIAAKTARAVIKGKFATLHTAEEFLDLSLECYQNNMFSECIAAASKSVALKPSANAYNNLCAAHNQLGEYEKALEACDKALGMDKEHTLAKGNREFAKSRLNLP